MSAKSGRVFVGGGLGDSDRKQERLALLFVAMGVLLFLFFEIGLQTGLRVGRDQAAAEAASEDVQQLRMYGYEVKM